MGSFPVSYYGMREINRWCANCAREIDAEVMGLWVKVEKAVYDGLKEMKAKQSGEQNGQQNGGLDGYQQYVANIER